MLIPHTFPLQSAKYFFKKDLRRRATRKRPEQKISSRPHGLPLRCLIIHSPRLHSVSSTFSRSWIGYICIVLVLLADIVHHPLAGADYLSDDCVRLCKPSVRYDMSVYKIAFLPLLFL